MSNQNEIDDILNELKDKKRAEGKPPVRKNFDIDFAKADEAEVKNQNNNFNIINASFKNETPKQVDLNQIYTDDDYDEPADKKKKIIIIAVIAVLAVALIVGGIFIFTKNRDKESETTTTPSTSAVSTTEAPVKILNPLTGEDAYNTSAVGKRPVACVVENAAAARPQWGIADNSNPPDIILEGEVEGGETRMLWFYADYTSLPSQIGPVRSARPPFIRFSELFDSIFIHWGQSSSKDNYIGADTVFQTDNVDHINQMSYSDKFGLFGRDSSRGVSSEHTGVLYGDKLEAAIEDSGFRTEADESSFTKFSFNEEDKPVGTESCTAFGLTFSSNTKTRDWTYNAEDKMYHSTDYKTDVARKNLLVLYDTTQYVSKSNYGGSGRTEIYCNYELDGGSGKLVSLGTITEITWSVENGVLVIKDASGKDVNLNPGTTWIGYGSSNHGGTDNNNTPA
ncbi:MAG: DUF3048 domain-containing protein [Eubacterium sp.]|nr:DUF3048 domain-containing protein [Eubacterium sp.]